MYTSLVLFALSGVFAPSIAVQQPTWWDDYGLARNVGWNENKPLAVFVGKGEKGWEQLSRDGKFDREIVELLKANYVCVYVDISNEDGSNLASAFSISRGPGLVLSNRKGLVQAFRHEGDLDNRDLGSYLRRYSETETVASTESPRGRVSNYYNPGEATQPAVRGGTGRSC